MKLDKFFCNDTLTLKVVKFYLHVAPLAFQGSGLLSSVRPSI